MLHNQQTSIRHSLLAVICSICLVLLSCSKRQAYDPQKDESIPVAIRAIISEGNNCACAPYIHEYQWREQTVYLYSCGGPACDCVTLYYDKAGQQITMPASYTPHEFQKEARLLREVWRCNK